MKKEVGNRIKLIRKNLGLSMEDFGKLFTPKASKGVVSNWENNYNLPNNERLKKIAELGNVSTSYLLEGKKTKEDFIYIAKEELKKNPEQIEILMQFRNGVDSAVKNLAESAKNLLDDVDIQVDDIHKNLFIVHASEFLDNYPPETIGLIASTLQRFNEMYEEIQDSNITDTELKKHIETQINEEIELSPVVFDSVKEVLHNKIDNKK